jgi:hypothetical protein
MGMVPQIPSRRHAYKQKVLSIYAQYNPSLGEEARVDTVLQQWRGREEELITALESKYGPAAHCLRSLAALRPLDPRKHSSSAGAVVPAAQAIRHQRRTARRATVCSCGRRDRRQRCAGRCRRVMMRLKVVCIGRGQRCGGRWKLSPSRPARGSGASFSVSPCSTNSPTYTQGSPPGSGVGFSGWNQTRPSRSRSGSTSSSIGICYPWLKAHHHLPSSCAASGISGPIAHLADH